MLPMSLDYPFLITSSVFSSDILQRFIEFNLRFRRNNLHVCFSSILAVVNIPVFICNLHKVHYTSWTWNFLKNSIGCDNLCSKLFNWIIGCLLNIVLCTCNNFREQWLWSIFFHLDFQNIAGLFLSYGVVCYLIHYGGDST